MLPSPSSSPRLPLKPCTNFKTTPRQRVFSFFPTPPDEKKPKRQTLLTSLGPNKRVKLTHDTSLSDDTESSDDSEFEDSNDDVDMDAVVSGRTYAQRQAPIQRRTQLLIRPTNHLNIPPPSTLPILRSFVSSHKADTYRCVSTRTDTYLTPPYACAYSHGARQGGTPHLAVANEEGTVHIFNTSKREDWGPEPPRNTLQPHNNGIFETKWDPTDTLLATCSGDQSARITNVETGTITHVFRGHTSTVKCASWDPNHTELLATGGRDGTIYLWDLRIGEKHVDNNLVVVKPAMTVLGAHEEPSAKSKPRPRKGKQGPALPSVTSILYPEGNTYGLISSGSFDGILKYWDLRTPSGKKKFRSIKPKAPPILFSSPLDPTTLHGSRRPRGILSLTSGHGPTAGLLFALGADAHIHTYSLPSLEAQINGGYAHDNLKFNSFYMTLSVSPCGRWLASGGTSTDGRAFLFDVSNAHRPNHGRKEAAVQLSGQGGEVGAVDWAEDTLATCSDDGTVRVWRPSAATYRQCLQDPEEQKWDWLWSLSTS